MGGRHTAPGALVGIVGVGGRRAWGQYRRRRSGATRRGRGGKSVRRSVAAAWSLAVLVAAAAIATATAAEGVPPITVRAGKADSLNHALAVQFAEAGGGRGNGALTPVVEESQRAVANVIDAPPPRAH